MAAPAPVSNASAEVRRVLVPLDATPAAAPVLASLCARARQGEALEVCLLWVYTPTHEWQILKYREEEELLAHHQARAELFLSEAEADLEAAGIRVRRLFRSGEPLNCIRSAAEEYAADQILVATPDWWDCLTRQPAAQLLRQPGRTPVLAIPGNKHGC